MKLKKIAKLILALPVASLVLGACSKGPVGPDLVSASDSFDQNVSFTASTYTPDFHFETVDFSANFNEDVTWKIEVTGLSSGAVKSYRGTGKVIDDKNSNWDGGSSNVYFFRGNEQAVAKLYITGLDTVYTTDTLLINNGKYYDGQTYNGVKYILVDDFDNSKPTTSLGLGKATDTKDSEIVFGETDAMSVQGNNSYRMRGKDNNDNGWVGSINNEKLLELITVAPGFLQIPIDSGVHEDSLFFNVYVYGSGLVGTALEIKVYEIDNDTIASQKEMLDFAKLSTTVYDQSQWDGWIYDITVDWKGWKLVSVPYSSFRAANDLAAGGNGDRVKESWRVSGIALSLLSYPTTGMLTEIYVDNVYITQGGRFKP